MKKLKEMPPIPFKAVFSDLDDTLTEEGSIQPETYEAIYKLKNAGLFFVLVSGRPAGWADALMRLWPLDAMVFENGAGLMIRSGKKIETFCLADHTSVQEQKIILQEIFLRLRKSVPHIRLAKDQPYRLFDFAIDHAEDPPFLSTSDVDTLLALLKKDDRITSKLSSIHINFWCGKHTKVTACEEISKRFVGVGLENSVYCGDSPNDEPLFEYFRYSAGVANIQKFSGHLKFLPTYITENRSGKGFCELADHILQNLKACDNKKIPKVH